MGSHNACTRLAEQEHYTGEVAELSGADLGLHTSNRGGLFFGTQEDHEMGECLPAGGLMASLIIPDRADTMKVLEWCKVQPHKLLQSADKIMLDKIFEIQEFS